MTHDLLDAFRDSVKAGAFAILPGPAEPCIEVVYRSRGAKFVAMALPYDGALPQAVKAKFVVATAFKDRKLSRPIFQGYLCHALTQDKYRCAPKPEVVGQGLESLQEGLNQLKQGVSTKKFVVIT